ncbi:GNAT family N-acetyltransferase [Paraflavitalea pollutisoli]|uniref:GNAT family N-acetyltransferase n=1 Tax=Paraflavitalea pollutisoli TaxID=3034143 RepID=UPI0023ED7035|nr:GNAT family N-acetyltransferase [Paraflavitalea sp. H1-2-19X]
MPVIYSWIEQYRPEPCKTPLLPIRQLLETYQDLLTADYSQSLMALINHVPLMQIDIIRADLDEVSIREEMEPGDYSIHFLLSPEQQEPVSYFAQALNSCLYSFFSFPGIHRIYCKTAVNDRRSNSLLQEAGFILEKTISEYRGKVNIYRHDQVPTLME